MRILHGRVHTGHQFLGDLETAVTVVVDFDEAQESPPKTVWSSDRWQKYTWHPVDARPPAKNLRKRAVGVVPDIAEFAVAVMQMSGAAVKSVSQFLSKKHWTRCSVVGGSGEEGARGCQVRRSGAVVIGLDNRSEDARNV